MFECQWVNKTFSSIKDLKKKKQKERQIFDILCLSLLCFEAPIPWKARNNNAFYEKVISLCCFAYESLSQYIGWAFEAGGEKKSSYHTFWSVPNAKSSSNILWSDLARKSLHFFHTQLLLSTLWAQSALLKACGKWKEEIDFSISQTAIC